MNVREQYKLATLSKRMQRGVCSSNRVAVLCRFHFDAAEISIVIIHETTRSKFVYRLRPSKDNEYISLAKDQIVFLKNSLRLQTVDLIFNDNHPVEIERDFVPFLRQKQMKIRDIASLLSEQFKDESYEYLLNEGKDCRELELHMGCSPNFRPSQCPVLNVDVFHSLHGGWVTVDLLLTNFMNCKEINLGGDQFTPQQLNPFIKKWIEGSRIEYFNCNMNDATQFESIVDGIDAREILRPYTLHTRHSFGPNKCFLIKQVSGVEAVLYVKERYAVLTTRFSLNSPYRDRRDRAPDYTCDDDEPPAELEDEENDEEDSEVGDGEVSDDSEQDGQEDSDAADEASDDEDEEEDGESDEEPPE